MGNYILTTHEVGCLLRKYKQPNYIGATFLMTNRFVAGDQIGYYAAQGMTYYKDYYDSLQILSNSFHKVSKFHSTINETMENSPTNFYIAKNIGIIRKEKLNTSQTWNLIRYHIVQ